ncbi:MAG: dTDP-4-dehydrorhamnose 3,5-epimerase [Chthoniobacterales bacterium]|nr:dTDP-4-dehydrorhamnose 3,5-epimerase [Chthoniobacterales bacterium]
MRVEKLKIHGALLITPKTYGDERGFFLEMWNRKTYASIGLDFDFVQDNHSRSEKYVLRGLHYQVNGHAQGKLVWVSSGAVFDVIVDLREGSPTFGQWDGRVLTSACHERLWAPPGCAHGFLVISDYADFHYKCTDYYSPGDERVLRWDDPKIGIFWPIPIGIRPKLAPRDANAPDFLSCEKYPMGKPLGLSFPTSP